MAIARLLSTDGRHGDVTKSSRWWWATIGVTIGVAGALILVGETTGPAADRRWPWIAIIFLGGDFHVASANSIGRQPNKTEVSNTI